MYALQLANLRFIANLAPILNFLTVKARGLYYRSKRQAEQGGMTIEGKRFR